MNQENTPIGLPLPDSNKVVELYPADLVAIVAGVNLGSAIKVIEAMRAINRSNNMALISMVFCDLPPKDAMTLKRKSDLVDAATSVAKTMRGEAKVRLLNRLAGYRKRSLDGQN